MEFLTREPLRTHNCFSRTFHEREARGLRICLSHPNSGSYWINGSIDWMCLPRFDSAACFAAVLGDEQKNKSC